MGRREMGRVVVRSLGQWLTPKIYTIWLLYTHTHIRHTYINIYKRVSSAGHSPYQSIPPWWEKISISLPHFIFLLILVFIIFIYFLKCIYLHPYIKFVTILTVSVKTFLFTSICKESLSQPPNQSTHTDSYTLILRIAVKQIFLI